MKKSILIKSSLATKEIKYWTIYNPFTSHPEDGEHCLFRTKDGKVLQGQYGDFGAFSVLITKTGKVLQYTNIVTHYLPFKTLEDVVNKEIGLRKISKDTPKEITDCILDIIKPEELGFERRISVCAIQDYSNNFIKEIKAFNWNVKDEGEE